MPVDKKAIGTSLLTNTPIALGLDYLAAYGINSYPTIKKLIADIFNADKYQEDLLYYAIHPIENMTNALSHEMFLNAQPGFLGLIVLMTIREMWSKRMNRFEEASEYGAHGTSRWAEKSEIFNKKYITTKHDKNGMVLAKYNNKSIIFHKENRLNRNIALFGGSGSGKTAGFIKTNILFNDKDSIIVTDPKGELYEDTSEYKRKQGYKVHLVNFKDLLISDRYNPFDYVNDETDALKVAKTLIMNTSGDNKAGGDKFWINAESTLVSALILYVKYALPKEQHHFGSVFNLLLTPYKDMEKLFKELPIEHIARKAYAQVEKLEDKVRANVFISAAVTLDLWKYDKVCKFTYTSDFLFKDIAREKTIVYVMIPIAEEEFRPLISSFFSQIFTELYALADENFGVLPNNVIMLLDEFANIGRIPKFEERLSTTRSLGIEVVPVIQDLSQLEDRYSKPKAREIINNCDTRLMLGANELESARYFSGLIGKTTIRVQSMSENKGGNGASSGQSYQMTSRDLMTPDELTRMDEDEAIVFIKGQYPMRVQKAWYYEMKEFQGLSKESPKVSRYDFPMADRSKYEVFVPEIEKAVSLIKEPKLFKVHDEKTTLNAIVKKVEEQKAEEKEEENEDVLSSLEF